MSLPKVSLPQSERKTNRQDFLQLTAPVVKLALALQNEKRPNSRKNSPIQEGLLNSKRTAQFTKICSNSRRATQIKFKKNYPNSRRTTQFQEKNSSIHGKTVSQFTKNELQFTKGKPDSRKTDQIEETRPRKEAVGFARKSVTSLTCSRQPFGAWCVELLTSGTGKNVVSTL